MEDKSAGPQSIEVPFTWEQVRALRKWQAAGYVHALTCPNHHTLEVANAGLYCVECEYVQDWAPEVCLHLGPNPLDLLGGKS